MDEKTDVRVFEGASWVCAADWNKLLTSVNDLRTSLALAVDPVNGWLDVERPIVSVIIDIVADLQKDRDEIFELRGKVQEFNEAELRRVAELHDVYTEKANLKADLERALKDVAMFEDLANKAETARIIKLEACLNEIAKSAQCRYVPNWIAVRIKEVMGC